MFNHSGLSVFLNNPKINTQNKSRINCRSSVFLNSNSISKHPVYHAFFAIFGRQLAEVLATVCADLPFAGAARHSSNPARLGRQPSAPPDVRRRRCRASASAAAPALASSPPKQAAAARTASGRATAGLVRGRPRSTPMTSTARAGSSRSPRRATRRAGLSARISDRLRSGHASHGCKIKGFA